MPPNCSAPVSSNVRQRRLHSFRVHFGRSIIFASSRIRESLTAPHHFGPCPNTLKALRAGALRRAIRFGGMCLNRGRFTGLAYTTHANSVLSVWFWFTGCSSPKQRLCQRTAVGWRFAPACCAAQSVLQLRLSSASGASACPAALAKSVPDI